MDLISRQDAIDALGEEPEVWTYDDEYAKGMNVQWQYDRMAIEALPSAERKGEWVYHTEPLAFRPYGHYTCSLCNEIAWDKSNYCPNCGARMEGEEE